MMAHINCKCGYKFICPWDRYCAGCGLPLTRVNERPLVVMPVGLKVGGADKVSFEIRNHSQVDVCVNIPSVTAVGGAKPPKWLQYDPATGNEQGFILPPLKSKTISYDIDREVIEGMLRERSERELGASVNYPLRIFHDGDYCHQEYEVVFSLLGQADLRPAVTEFPSVWLTNHSSLRLALELYNASGENMRIESVRVHCPAKEHEDIVDALFPQEVVSGFRNAELKAGQVMHLALETKPINDVLRAMTEEGPWRFDDKYKDRHNRHWVEKWPSLTRLRFVVEATFRSAGTDPVPPVRSLVILTLVRPPVLRDATPDDDLWKRVDGQLPLADKCHELADNGWTEFVADLTNESSMPVTIDRIVNGHSWVEVLNGGIGKQLAPGDTVNVKVRVDMRKRAREELMTGRLVAELALETTPRMPPELARLDQLAVKARSTAELTGSLGIDFGTSNCAVCYIPDGPLPGEGSGLDPDPVPIPVDDSGSINLPSVLMRRLLLEEKKPDPEFAFGAEAERLEGVAPDNVLRGLKRILAEKPDREHRFRSSDTAATVKKYTTMELATRMLRHIVHQTARNATGSDPLRRRLLDAARASEGTGVGPTPEVIRTATAYRFTKAVFTHPVDATEAMKRVLYQCALDSELAHDDNLQPLSFEEFERTRLIDESSAAIGYFVSKHLPMLNDSPRADRPPLWRIVCLDIGGGTTDISVMELNPRAVFRRPDGTGRDIVPQLSLVVRKGINDFAGMDLDRAIVDRILVRKVDDKCVGAGSERVAKELLELAMQGFSSDVIEDRVRRMGGPSMTALSASGIVGATITFASSLRQAAEAAKKAASVVPDGQSTYTMPTGAPTWNGRDFGTLSSVIPVDIPHKDVNALVAELTAARLAAIDDALGRARWGWSEVDLLMFTGQTCRAPALRDAILKHVRQSRGGSLPVVAMPPSSASSEVAERILPFDPKLCVASGAALMGVKANTVRLRIPPQSRAEVRTHEGPPIRKGDPLPAFTYTMAFGDNDDECFVQVTADGRPLEAKVPSTHPLNTKYTVVVDEEMRVWLARTGDDGATVDPNAPEKLARSISEIPVELRKRYGMAGGVVTWVVPLTNGPLVSK